jgi:predicted transcriptional regulator
MEAGVPRKEATHLTDAELRLMDVLWEKGASTVSDVADALSKDSPLAYSSVLTTLRVLERKGYLTHSKTGRAFLYRPLVGRDQARQRAVSHLLHRFFENSPELLMLNLAGDGKIKPAELDRLKRRIEREQS